MLLLLLIVVTVATLSSTCEAFYFFRQNKTFPLDENARLKNHWLVHSNNAECAAYANTMWTNHGGSSLRLVASVDSPIADEIFGVDAKDKCYLGLLDRGTQMSLLHHVIPEKLWDASDMDLGNEETRDWLVEWGVRVELGFISYQRSPVTIYWLDQRGSRVEVGSLKFGEKHMVWQHTSLGHTFELEDVKTRKSLGRVIAQFDGMVAVGGRGGSYVDPSLNFTTDIGETLQHEIHRAHAVTRTFTEYGFSKSKLPLDIWASMDAYYYNNKDAYTREEWENKGYYVNWWERDAYIIHMPWDLKRYWQRRLQDLVTEWIGGTELEMTDIYGMRRYEDGARLLTHVDRTSTHATSLIINIAQGVMREPWAVEIYDFAGRLHLVNMEPGDIVYYESARCMHGRMKPLRGEYYVNLFSHYRPKGDPDWHTKANPDDGVKQVHDIGKCSVVSNQVECSKVPASSIPYISRNLESVTKESDLFDYWKSVSPTEDERAATIAGASISASSPPTSALHPVVAAEHSEL